MQLMTLLYVLIFAMSAHAISSKDKKPSCDSFTLLNDKILTTFQGTYRGRYLEKSGNKWVEHTWRATNSFDTNLVIDHQKAGARVGEWKMEHGPIDSPSGGHNYFLILRDDHAEASGNQSRTDRISLFFCKNGTIEGYLDQKLNGEAWQARAIFRKYP